MRSSDFLKNGKMEIGCNYWASHAGTSMWSSWNQESIEKDFATLEEFGMTILRVFPLWPDFQPVGILRNCGGTLREFCDADGNTLEPDSDGMDPVMLERFRFLADCAEKHHLKLIIGLLTGWMSGRQFVPPALDGRNLYTDPEALRWECRFIRRFVAEFKDHPALLAWEPGNECNCLSQLGPNENAESWKWMALIGNAIRAIDPNHPFYSGMHGGHMFPTHSWNLLQLGELCDGLTTHPYPLFTPECGKSALTTLPAVLHSTAETLYYRGLSEKPAFIEEIGTLGPAMLSEKRTADYVRITILSGWVHNCLAHLWWCAFDQTHLDHAPYRWVALERELGYFHTDRKPHPSAAALKETAELLKNLPFKTLPERKIHAQAILTQDMYGSMPWQTAYGSFLLAKQAGFEIEFTTSYRLHIPEASFYWIPAFNAANGVTKPYYLELIRRVKEGASLLVTDQGHGILQPFKEFFGCEFDYTALTPENLKFTIPGTDETIQITRDTTRKLLVHEAKVLIRNEADGSPLLIMNEYGKGKIFYLNCAPEMSILNESEPQWYKVYRMIANLAGMNLPEKAPEIGRTIHEFSDGSVYEIELNYSDREVSGIAPDSMRITKK